jgi:hypothetical protein
VSCHVWLYTWLESGFAAPPVHVHPGPRTFQKPVYAHTGLESSTMMDTDVTAGERTIEGREEREPARSHSYTSHSNTSASSKRASGSIA